MSGNNVMSRSMIVRSPMGGEFLLPHGCTIVSAREVPQRMTAQPSLEEQRMADKRVRQLLRDGAL